MTITADLLKAIMPAATPDNAARFAGPLDQTCTEFQINTPQRMAAFLAQLAHESGSLLYVRELASGQAYEGRKDLGNTQPGDGVRFKGRGLIQITGRTNYGLCGKALDCDFTATPEKLEQPAYAARSAGWFWATHKLNDLADKGDDASFETITRRINGGLNGQQERQAFFVRAKHALGIA